MNEAPLTMQQCESLFFFSSEIRLVFCKPSRMDFCFHLLFTPLCDDSRRAKKKSELELDIMMRRQKKKTRCLVERVIHLAAHLAIGF